MNKKIITIYVFLAIICLLNACTVANEENAETEAVTVESQDKVFEGRYFDEGIYQYIDMPEAESPFIYCEIIVSNVTGTSFEFTINETVMATGESKNIMPVKTAVFIGDGTRAIYQDDNQTLIFTFPDETGIYPRHMEVSGLEKLEGNVYINNSIPGHESG